MKIALVCPASLPATQFGGIVFLAVDLAREMSELGHNVTIYTTDLDFSNGSNKFNKDLPRVERFGKFKINRTNTKHRKLFYHPDHHIFGTFLPWSKNHSSFCTIYLFSLFSHLQRISSFSSTTLIWMATPNWITMTSCKYCSHATIHSCEAQPPRGPTKNFTQTNFSQCELKEPWVS